MSKTITHNADSVDFGELGITTTLSTGFDGDAEDHQKREVTLHFVGFEDLSKEMKSKMLEELAGKLRIKVNGVAGPLKGNAVDYDTYVQYLDDNDCEFTFNVADLYAPSGKKSPKEELMSLYRRGEITKAQLDSMIQTLEG